MTDPETLRRYYREVEPLLERFGGRIIALSAEGEDVVEGDSAPALHAIQRWDSRAAFDKFWKSPEYQRVKDLRHRSCDSQIRVFES